MKSSLKSTSVGKISEDWEVINLSSICDILMGQSPPSSTYNTDSDGPPFFQGRKDFRQKYPVKTIWCSEPTRTAQQNNILLSVRAPIGDVNVAKEKCCIGRGLAALSMRNGNNEFLYYLMLCSKNRLKRIFESEGTVFGCITKSGLHNFEVTIPKDEDTQRAIAKTLSDLDEKSELNRQMNKTLESIAQAVFKRWFLDFEFPDENGKPYKSSGGKMIESELGMIPERWKDGTVVEVFNFTMGQSPPGKTYNEIGEGIAFFQGRTDFGYRFPVERVYCTAPTRYANPDDTLVTVRAPVGDVNMALQKCCIGRGLAAIRHKSGSRSFTYYAMRMLRQTFDNYEAEGTVFGSIGKDDFNLIKVVIPSLSIVQEFEKWVYAIDQLIEENETSTCVLASVRDSLLPKLMSGRIRIKE